MCRVFFFFFFQIICTQRIIDTVCTVTSTRGLGVCKLLNDCKKVRDDVLLHQKLPQTCGFQGTQAIVCCPVSNEPKRPGDISRLKCKEYSSYARDGTKSECGHTIIKRIAGGERASRKEFPHMAALGFERNPPEIEWSCGGSIISERYILTAAHCLLSSYSGAPKYVRVGVTNLNDTNSRQEIKIDRLIPHPEYTVSSFYHNIALIHLEKPIKFNAYARPACLNLKSKLSVDKLIATGWGLTYLFGSPSDDLLKVTLNIIENDVCNRTYVQFNRRLKSGILKDQQICVGSTTEEAKGICQGDSGGPLQTYHTSDDVFCMYDIVGVISFGKGCEETVGTRVSYYIDWIEKNVWPEFSSS